MAGGGISPLPAELHPDGRRTPARISNPRFSVVLDFFFFGSQGIRMSTGYGRGVSIAVETSRFGAKCVSSSHRTRRAPPPHRRHLSSAPQDGDKIRERGRKIHSHVEIQGGEDGKGPSPPSLNAIGAIVVVAVHFFREVDARDMRGMYLSQETGRETRIGLGGVDISSQNLSTISSQIGRNSQNASPLASCAIPT